MDKYYYDPFDCEITCEEVYSMEDITENYLDYIEFLGESELDEIFKIIKE